MEYESLLPVKSNIETRFHRAGNKYSDEWMLSGLLEY